MVDRAMVKRSMSSEVFGGNAYGLQKLVHDHLYMKWLRGSSILQCSLLLMEPWSINQEISAGNCASCATNTQPHIHYNLSENLALRIQWFPLAQKTHMNNSFSANRRRHIPNASQ